MTEEEPHDIHTRTAAALYEVKESEVTPEMRKAAKVVNYSPLYGSPKALQKLKDN